MRLFSFLAAALVATVATAQVTIPAHVSVYNGYTRGYNFTAQTAFNIVQLELPTVSQQIGDTAGFLVRVNGNVALRSVGNVGPTLTTSIPVIPGDVVDVMGNWSPAAPGTFTAHNSYGSATAGMGAAPYATTILGVPHTLNRCGWQNDIANPAWSNATGYLAPVAGQIGRVGMYVSGGSGTVLGTNTSIGAGCYRKFSSFYESFASAGAFDLSNTAFTMTATGGSYIALPIGAFLPVGSVQASPTVLALTDDSEATQAFTVGTFPGWTGVTVCSNGYVSKAVGNGTGFTPTPATFLAGTQDWLSVGWHDFNPAAAGSGTVKFEESASVISITWDGVYDFAGTTAANANTMQVQLYPNGDVVYAYGTMSTLGGTGFLTGYSPGGVNLDPGSIDLSASLPAAVITQAPEQDALGLVGNTRPIINASWDFNTTNIPATSVIGVEILGLSDPGFNDLFFIGMPGCGLRANLDYVNAFLVAGSSHSWSLALPNNAALLNLHIFATSAVLAPTANAFGWVTSNGIDGSIGDY